MLLMPCTRPSLKRMFTLRSWRFVRQVGRKPMGEMPEGTKVMWLSPERRVLWLLRRARTLVKKLTFVALTPEKLRMGRLSRSVGQLRILGLPSELAASVKGRTSREIRPPGRMVLVGRGAQPPWETGTCCGKFPSCDSA